MSDRNLANDRVKLVQYSIVTVRRGFEEILKTYGEEVVTENMTGEVFASWVIAKYSQENNISEDDRRYLRVYHDIIESWEKQDLKYEENRLKYEDKKLNVLGAIVEALQNRRPSQYEIKINSIGMRLVKLPASEFLMGSPDLDSDANNDEKPQHLVRITKPFFIGVYTVTVAQWRQFVDETGYLTEGEQNGMGSVGLDLTNGLVSPHPDYTWRSWLREDAQHPSDFVQTDNHPVVCVSWNDAQEFCAWLSRKENATYRLPTEAEWEYACRAGTTTRFHSGDDEDSLQRAGNIADASLQLKWFGTPPGGAEPIPLPPYAKPWNDGYPFTAPGGQFEPNPFGLYDMHGNVGEWCSDWYAEDYYQQSPTDDPQGPAEGQLVPIDDRIPGAEPRTLRVLRGGVWLDPASGCRSADRWTHRRHPVDTAADIGFRVVLEDND